ncbi:MAG TPA: response regulator [Solirubrobacteraceae bacterium]|nr:response regulator [Solirubrobacteraceae bacterium]
MALSVLIVDDERDFRMMAGRLLTLRGFDVAGHADDGAAAVRLARSLEPQAVLLDVNLPDTTGFEVARRLAALPVPPRVLLTSADREVTDELLDDCGASAFVPKDELPSSDLSELFGDERLGP